MILRIEKTLSRTLKDFLSRGSNVALSTTLLWAGLGLLAVYLIDVHNLLGIRESRAVPEGSRGIWSAYFGTKGPTEVLQWLALMGGGLASFATFRKSGNKFWLFLGIALSLALWEDSMDFRDQTRRVLANFIPSIFVDFIHFGSIIAITGYGILRYGMPLWFRSKGAWRIILPAGLGFYAFMGAYDLFAPHYEVGKFINDVLASGQFMDSQYYIAREHEFLVSISDAVVEEGGEFVAAGLTLSGILAYHESL